ncbi:MAG: DUF1579 domain-containing protein, partial [Bacteroidetes bacterium]
MKQSLQFVIVTMFFIICQSVAQQQSTSGESTELKLTPSAVREKLAFLVGNFTTETNMPASPMLPKDGTGKGSCEISWALDSMFLLIDDKSSNSVFGTFNQHGVLGYDAMNNQFTLSMFNNFGDRPSYKGNFVGDTLIMETKIPMPGRSFDQKILWYKDGDAVKLQVLNDMGKGFALTLEQTAKRV